MKPNNELNFIFTEHGFYVDPKTSIEHVLFNAFEENRYDALYQYGFKGKEEHITASANYLYEVVQAFYRSLAETAGIELARENVELQVTDDTYDSLLVTIPMCIGEEYVNREWLDHIFAGLLDCFKVDIREYQGSVKMYFDEKTQHLHVAERIFFHLVEQKDEMFPFAFLATYASKQKTERLSIIR